MRSLLSVITLSLLLCFSPINPSCAESYQNSGTLGSLTDGFIGRSWFRGARFIGNAKDKIKPIKLSIGWLEHPKGLSFNNDLPKLPGGITNVRQRPLRGVMGSVTMSGKLSDRFNLELTGATLFSREADGTITSNIGLTADFEGHGVEWSYVESILEWEYSNNFSLLAGLRWDHTKARFHVIRPATSNDDFIVNAYLPVFGVQAHQAFAFGNIAMRVIGSPFAPGSLKFHTWSEVTMYSQESNQDFTHGYLFEIQGEWRKNILGSMDVSLFGKWDLFRAKTLVDNALVPAPVLDISWSMDRKSWTVGASVLYKIGLI